MESLFPRTPNVDVLIIIPTVATSRVLLPSFERLLEHLDGYRVHIVASVNPVDPEQGYASIEGMERLWRAKAPRTCQLTIYHHPGPCGFGGAINRGLWAAVGVPDGAGVVAFETCPASLRGIPEDGLTIVWNDDLHVTKGWLRGMMAAKDAEWILLSSEIPTEAGGFRPWRPVSSYGVIGIVGPATNNAAGLQQIGSKDMQVFREMGLDDFAAWYRQRSREVARGGEDKPVVYDALFTSGFCQGYTADLMNAIGFALVSRDGRQRPCLFDERYTIAGYEDNDLCVRADIAGFRAAIAADTFIGHLGHQTFDAMFPEMQRGLRNRLVYYDIWRHRPEIRGTKLVAAFRVRLDVPNDVNLFRMAMAGIGRLVDGIAILLTGPLSAMRDTEEWQEWTRAGTLPQDAKTLGTTRLHEEVAALQAWAQEWSAKIPDSRRPSVMVERWSGDFNERVERNRVLQMAETMGADWVLSVDHDEVIEPRVSRSHLERLMRHPDPMVQEWDFSWINHWNDNRWQNLTPPWGDAGRYIGGMHGYRMYRVNRGHRRQIQAGGNNGLHCGNIPQVGPEGKRVSGIRFRHFGYMRVQDRTRKLGRYNEQDPTPNPVLVGGTSYAHITHEENQLMSAFPPVNGIGLHFLAYEGESPNDIGRNLDALYGLADRIVGVWTGEWTEVDRRQLYASAVRHDGNRRGTLRPKVDLWSVPDAEWPATGPSREMACMAEHFGVEWVVQPLNDHIGNARNAAVDALHGTPGLGWGLFFDPDEIMPQNACVMLRRMAEVTDSWGWLFSFINRHTKDGDASVSQAVRMHRLDERGIMRFDGRVHEGFDLAVTKLQEDGYGSILRVAHEAMTVLNTGLALPPTAMQDKLDRYRRLTEMELADDPKRSKSWITLGLYWANEGFYAVAEECFNRAILCAGRSFRAYHEAALHKSRMAMYLFSEAADRMGNHSERKVVEAILDFGERAFPPLQILGIPGRQGMTEMEALTSLPPFSPE